jgi:hypothetical protein
MVPGRSQNSSEIVMIAPDPTSRRRNQRRWDMAENDDFGYPNGRSPLGRIPSSQEVIRLRRESVTTTLPIRFGPALQ